MSHQYAVLMLGKKVIKITGALEKMLIYAADTGIPMLRDLEGIGLVLKMSGKQQGLLETIS